jgi:hypothetical protein
MEMTEEPRWAQLRQVVLATLDHAGDLELAKRTLQLGPSFDDPELATIGLADATMPVGPDTYLEICAPMTEDHQVAKWLRKAGGKSGWCLSTQVPNLEGVRERCEQLGVRIAIEAQALGHEIIQLHPLDVGVLLELDSFVPRDEWFWDDLEAAKVAQAQRGTFVDDIMGVEVAVEDPAAMATTWATIIGLPAPELVSDGAVLFFSGRPIRLVSLDAVAGRRGLVAVTMHTSDRTRVGDSVDLCNTKIRFV